MNKPLVTVVIPVYNKAATVARSIESVKKQTLNNFECFVVDNNSKDDSVSIVKDAIKDDDRFHLVTCKEQGVAHARNYGIAQGDAPFVCCLDSDDAIDPIFLETCVVELRKDRSLGIAYTGLHFIQPDGKEGLSTWPTPFDPDAQLTGKNQIPTCCVYRREMWERLGGYRQRYADPAIGAGAEDAELWLRSMAYGWNAKKVTDAGLFIYSWLSGSVSGNRAYRQPDYRIAHPWTRHHDPPFASLTTPKNKLSHPVRQYDQPVVSVVIPVGKGHEKIVADALDSLESQTFPQWEAVIAWDSLESYDHLLVPYPYARIFSTGGQMGAGHARNLGVRQSRAQLVLFMDADDTLHGDCIDKLLEAYIEQKAIIYSDYVGKAFIDDELARKMEAEGRLIERHKDGWALLAYHSSEYECERAQRQPDQDMYIWNLVTSLTPKAWHDEIGGFDEKMPSWEDWDYWIRMARAGKCFIRLPEQLVAYRFYGGQRRDRGLAEHKSLIQYMLSKYRGQEIMACSTCGKKAKNANPAPARVERAQAAKVSDGDFVLVKYLHHNVGRHMVYGGNLFSTKPDGVTSVGTQGGFKINYGYRSGGERFYVHRADLNAQPHLFEEIQMQAPPVPEEPSPVEAPPPPKSVTKAMKEAKADVPFDLASIPNITPLAAQQLNAMGVHTLADLEKVGEEGLRAIKGIGANRARGIMRYLETLQKA